VVKALLISKALSTAVLVLVEEKRSDEDGSSSVEGDEC